jgi:mannose-1-phosphate guanylyltransferase
MGRPAATLAEPAPPAVYDSDPALWAIVFAGGIGSRFWPLSTPKRPKAVLRLLGDRPLVADTIHRLLPLVPFERVLVLTSSDIADAVRAAIPEIPAHNVLIEPRPLGTAAALAWGLDVIAKRGGGASVACAVHADLAAAFPDAFRRAVQRAAVVAQRGRALVALGVPPTRTETAFGYIVPGEPLDPEAPASGGGPCRALRFVEKPPLDVVVELLSDGALWHSGIVVGRVADLSAELFEHARELQGGREALGRNDLRAFATVVRPVSIERGLLERTRNIIVQPVECGWDDVGTWACLRRARDLDDDGNGAIGEAHFFDSTSNVVHSEDGRVVLFGCDRLLVVRLDGITFVTPLERAADLRPLLDRLPPGLRTDQTTPPP